MSQTKIKIPVGATGNPDWEFMENYGKRIITQQKENCQLLQHISLSSQTDTGE